MHGAQLGEDNYLLKGDVLEVILLNDGCPVVLVVRHELGQGDAKAGADLQIKPFRQHRPQLHINKRTI